MESKEAGIIRVWEFWNECNIVRHRDLSKFSGTISGRLNFYSAAELCQAIRTYKDILLSERHWFSYTWTLDQFLSRKDDDGASFYRAINKEEFGAPEIK